MRRSSRPIPFREIVPADCMSTLRLYRPRCLPSAKDSRVNIVIKPRPPTWIRLRMTSWPNSVQPVKVSRTISPVTQVALVEVKSASRNPAGAPFEATGSISKPVPTRMIAKKPSAISRAGVICRRFMPALRFFDLRNL